MSLEFEDETATKQKRQASGSSTASFALPQMGYVGHHTDIEKYSVAERELSNLLLEEGYKYFTHVFEVLADYNIIVVPLVYKPKDEILLAKIIASIRGWDDVKVAKLTKLLMEKADVLEKLGHPLSQIVYALENAPVSVKITEATDKVVGGGISAHVVTAEGKYKQKELTSIEAQSNVETVRTAISMVLDSVDKPTLLILSERELEVLGAETILNSVVANPNLVIVVFLPSRPSKEFVKLVTSDRVVSLNIPIMYSSMKSYIINAYLAMAKNLAAPSIIDVVVQGRSKTKRGIAHTIQLLVETGLLQRAVGIYLYRLANPLLVISATNNLIAKVYAQLERSPEAILGLYRKGDKNTRSLIRRELAYVVDKLINKVELETVMERLSQPAVSTIYNMIISLAPAETLTKFFDKSTLKTTKYPAVLSQEGECGVVEFLRKIGVLSVWATRRGYYNLSPGVRHLYEHIKALLTSSPP